MAENSECLRAQRGRYQPLCFFFLPTMTVRDWCLSLTHCIQVTPTVIRLRKRLLDPAERDKAARGFAKSMRKD